MLCLGLVLFPRGFQLFPFFPPFTLPAYVGSIISTLPDGWLAEEACGGRFGRTGAAICCDTFVRVLSFIVPENGVGSTSSSSSSSRAVRGSFWYGYGYGSVVAVRVDRWEANFFNLRGGVRVCPNRRAAFTRGRSCGCGCWFRFSSCTAVLFWR